MGFLRDLFDDVGYVFNGGNYFGGNEKQEDMDWQERMQMRQNDFNMRMWNLNNQYNSPANQMSRLRAAGLSGSGAAAMLAGAGNSASPVVSSNQPTAPDQNSSQASLSAITQAVKEFSLLSAQKENLNADTRDKNANANRNESTLLFDIDLLKKRSKDFDVQWNKIAQELQLTKEQTKNWNILNRYAAQKSQSEIDQIKASIDETNQRIELMKKQGQQISNDIIKQEWENTFRQSFGIDPNSGEMQMLIQCVLSGQFDKVLNAFEKGVNILFDAGQKYANNAINKGNEIVNKALDSADKPLNPINPKRWKRNRKRLLDIFNAGNDIPAFSSSERKMLRKYEKQNHSSQW